MNEYELYWSIFHAILGFASWSYIMYAVDFSKSRKRKAIDPFDGFCTSLKEANRALESFGEAMKGLYHANDK